MRLYQSSLMRLGGILFRFLYTQIVLRKDCTICLEKPIDTIVLPCRHMFLCSDCSNNFQIEDQRKCSICRKRIIIIQLYLNVLAIRTFVRIKSPEVISEGKSPAQE